ncbi:MAG: alpha/beta hydrolase [Rhodospirillaceae bacterium]|jgi:pimeloyl-ACP methyl ester carboxylesterase|nr:alpha/beta hydrolase [Rhodospirillaceae bacterium]
MTFIETNGTKLYTEAHGKGPAIIFVHEFADNLESWSMQIAALSRRYKCITFNARGYPPSGVPEEPEQYSQKIAAEDIKAVLDGYSLQSAHIVGCSMGAFAALHFAILYPENALSIALISCGYGAPKDQQDAYAKDSEMLAEKYREIGSEAMAEQYANGVFRQQFKNKDLKGWQAFKERLASHSEEGAALTMLGVQRKRPSLYDLEEQIIKVNLPALVVVGDEDDWCIEPSIFLKRTLPRSGLCILPRTGHTVNLEEPTLTNLMLVEFLAMVESGDWSAKQDYLGKSALLSGLK